MSPKISIIMPCYNHGQYIKEAIQSVEHCSDKGLYEIIILNDGSTDKYTIEVLQELANAGYNVIHQHNQGLGAARNNAIKKAVGEYILPLDSDNKISASYIYESIKILDAQQHIAMVYSDAEYFGEKTGRNHVGEFNLQKLMIGNYIDACAVFRKSVWESLDGYDENMPVMGMEDWELWLKMALNGYEFYYIPQVLFYYRVLGNSMLSLIKSRDAVVLENYMQKKHKKYLNRQHINDYLITAGRKNRNLAFKFLLAVYLPGVLRYLVKKNLVKTENIF